MTNRQAWRVWGGATVLACLLVNPYVRGDGNGYYAWLVSPVVDGDLDFTNQFRRADPLFQQLVFADDGIVRPEAITPVGRVGNQWSVGPAVLWAPWFLAAHLGVTGARLLGATLPADGYSWPYLWTVAMGTVVYGMLALWLSVRTATHLGYGRSAGLAAIAIGLASSLPVYQVFLPFHVHALAACAVAAFVMWGVTQHDSSRLGHWAVWGALAGLMVQVYQLNGVFALAAMWVWAATLGRDGVVMALRHGVAFTAAAVLVGVPQLLGKAIVYGTPLTTGYQDTFAWSEPRLWHTAFSANHGWVVWTPVVAVALVGLVWAWGAHGSLRPWMLSSGAFYLVVASYQNWHGQSSFGNRFFVSLSVFLVVGVAVCLDWCRTRGVGAWRLAGAGLAVLIVWNAGFAFQWGTNIIPNRGPVSFREVAVNQITVVPARVSQFLGRYVTDRRSVQDDVEREDVPERRDYRVVR